MRKKTSAIERLWQKKIAGDIADGALHAIGIVKMVGRSEHMINRLLRALELFNSNKLATVSNRYIKDEALVPREMVAQKLLSERVMLKNRSRLIKEIAQNGSGEACERIGKKLFGVVRIKSGLYDLMDLRYGAIKELNAGHLERLLTMDQARIVRTRNIGGVTIRAIENVLRKEGLKLGMSREEFSIVFYKPTADQFK